MNKIIAALIVALTFLCNNIAKADSSVSAASLWYTDIQLSYYVPQNSGESNVTGFELFTQRAFSSESAFGFYGLVVNETEFWNAFLGLTYSISDFQFGFGAGYIGFKDGERHFTFNHWGYWEKGQWTVNTYVEFTPSFDTDAWFYRGDVYYTTQSGRFSSGIYTELWNGTGPLVALNFGNNWTLSGAYLAWGEPESTVLFKLVKAFD